MEVVNVNKITPSQGTKLLGVFSVARRNMFFEDIEQVFSDLCTQYPHLAVIHGSESIILYDKKEDRFILAYESTNTENFKLKF